MRVVQMSPFSAPFMKPSPIIDVPAEAKREAPSSKKFDPKRFKADDWILLAIIAVLIFEGSDDYILLCALGYLFLMGL